MTRCDNCGSYEECLIIDGFGDEIIGDEDCGTPICPDCYSVIYRRGWNEDWYRDDWR